MPQFVHDVEEIRQRAIRRIEDGAVTEAYGVDKDKAIEILNEALATEIVCVLRYMHHYFMATGVHGKSVAGEFKEHADAEREHADMLAERIQQLGGKPDFNPKNLLERSASQYIEGETLADMIREDLIAERVVIEVYTEMIRFFGNDDPTTRVILEKLLHDEEEHADDLASLLYVVDPRTGEELGEDPGTRPLQMQGGKGLHKAGKQQERRSSEENGGFGQRQDDHTAELHPEDTELGRAAAVSHNREQSQERNMEQKGQGRSKSGGRQQQQGQGRAQTGEQWRKQDSRGPQSSQRDQRHEAESRTTQASGEQQGRNDREENNQRGQRKPNRNALGASGSRQETHPARPEERPESNRGRGAAVAPAHQPGGRGRPMNRRQQEMSANIEPGDVAERANEGAQGGATRAVRVTQPNRKKRIA